MAEVIGTDRLLDCDIVIVRGCTLDAQVSWTDEDGEPWPLSGGSAACQVRAKNDGPLWLDIGPHVTLADGMVTISVPASATAECPAGRGVWDLVVTDAGGAVTRVLAGKATVADPVSEDDG